MTSPSSHEVRMVETSRHHRRSLKEVDDGESSNKRARHFVIMVLFDEIDTSDWQDTVWEAQLTEARDEHDRQDILMDQQAQPDTDVAGLWRCQIEPKSDLYGNKTSKLLDPEKVVKGRLTEFKHVKSKLFTTENWQRKRCKHSMQNDKSTEDKHETNHINNNCNDMNMNTRKMHIT